MKFYFLEAFFLLLLRYIFHVKSNSNKCPFLSMRLKNTLFCRHFLSVFISNGKNWLYERPGRKERYIKMKTQISYEPFFALVFRFNNEFRLVLSWNLSVQFSSNICFISYTHDIFFAFIFNVTSHVPTIIRKFYQIS